MSFEDLHKQIEALKDGIVQAVDDATEAVAAGYSAELIRRVQFLGENSKEQKLGTYAQSTSIYKRNRGQESQFVNLTDTFQMLSSIGLQKKSRQGNAIVYVIAPDEAVRGKITNKELMAIHEERYGEIMAPTDEESAVIIQIYQDVITRRINNF